MNKVGRPKNGPKQMWVLGRETLVNYAYGRARDAGEKHSEAVSEAVKYIREIAPRMPISETEVKRIIAGWRPKGAAKCLLVSKPGPLQNIISVPTLKNGAVSFISCRVLYTVARGPRPIYPRTNAALKPTENRAHLD